MNHLWWLVAIGYLVGAVLALRDRPRPGARRGDEPELEPVEVGALFSYPHAVAVAITELLLLERITVERGRHLRRRGTEPTATLHPFTAAVLRKVPRSTTITYDRLIRNPGHDWRNLSAEVTDRGYLGCPPGRWRVVADALMAMPGILLGPVGLVVFGSPVPTVLRWVFGVAAAVLLIRAVVLTVDLVREWFGRRRSLRRTSRGDRVIAELAHTYRHLTPDRRPSTRLYGPRESAMAVALFGPDAVDSIGRVVRTESAAAGGVAERRRAGALFGVSLLGFSYGGSASCSGAYGVWADAGVGGHGGGGGHAGPGCGGGGCGGGD
ncbi:TIGR04222 domain-containing membrane protein [Millisia brevis]|uniref:TIGR04222 domain-containing membrane protein n=1 Tax=Millisia brevis TaxID=264148 RepID=UPI00082BA46B|nr:TIGR04222 domain-containing membrane protein [Millisia brevis]